ncbi:hypothetical protein Dimus_031483 [Dionaea muscipula]
MNDNGLSKVMDLIKRQRWDKLLKRRELVHVDAVKEFYARLTLSHYKKEVARSSVRGVEIEFDLLKLASILGVPGNNGICEYIKDVWEERRDDEDVAPAEELNEKKKNRINQILIGKLWLMRLLFRGNLDQMISFLMHKLMLRNQQQKHQQYQFSQLPGDSTNVQKEPAPAGVDPLAPTGSIPDAIFSSL